MDFIKKESGEFMHMADALLSPAVAGTMYACSSIAAGYSVKKIRKEDNDKKIPVMGVMGAFVFAAQMINFTIPGTGSSGHLCGGMLLSAVLGPEAGFITMIGVLLVQGFLFADGGLLALGAFSVTLETLASGVTKLPFAVFLAAMQPIHLAIGCVEGAVTAAVLVFIYETRPELLWNYKGNGIKENRLSYKQVVIVFAAAAAVTGGLLSLVASSAPDGLEWSIGKVAGTTELEAEGSIYSLAEGIQSFTSLLPDYSLKDSSSSAGTAFSGILGGIAVIAVCAIACYIIKYFRKKALKGQENE